MDGSITDEQAHKWLQEIAQGAEVVDAAGHISYSGSWVSLHYDSPALAGEDRAELAGGGYTRAKMVWKQPNNRSIWSQTDARFTGLMQTKITYFGVWDFQVKGMLRAYAELPEPAAVLNGKGFVLLAETLAVSFG